LQYSPTHLLRKLNPDSAGRLIALAIVGLIVASCGGGGSDGSSSGGGGSGGGGTGGGGSGGTASGLENRPDSSACEAPQEPVRGSGISLVDIFPDAPGASEPPYFVTKAVQAPGDDSRWYLLEKQGRISVLDTATQSVSKWLNYGSIISAPGEAGLLGIAFDPQFPATPHVYISYTVGNGDQSGDTTGSRVSRLILNDTTNPTEGGTVLQELIAIDQPFDSHNGGNIDFGPDGFLYLGLGDGGSANDPDNNSQDTTTLRGAMLRIDVRGVPFSEKYRIPSDNPFAGNAKCGPGSNASDCPEIFAWGLRNPWRWSFDSVSGDLWLGDVGQGAKEEINIIRKGANYGWDCREGNDPLNPPSARSPVCASLSTADFEQPLLDFVIGDNQAVVGGYVYRGNDVPELRGRYVFADYSSGRVFALQDLGGGNYDFEEIFSPGFPIATLAVDNDNELYVLQYGSNSRLYKVEQAVAAKDTVPEELVAGQGCLDPAVTIPYSMTAPFWSDDAVKTRFMSVPNGKFISVANDDDWDFPRGTVLVKSFELGGEMVETRLLMRHTDTGNWKGYTYEWNQAGTRATRLTEAKAKQVSIGGGQTQTWIYPSEAECLQCHTSAAGFTLGPETAQLNGDNTYESTGVTANQLETLAHIGMFEPPAPSNPDAEPAFPDPFGNGDLEDRARAYLHTNCAQCHRPGGPTQSAMDLRYQTPFADMNACDIEPSLDDLGISDARLIAPGAAWRSVVYRRMNTRGDEMMPPMGSAIVDADGAELLQRWINSLDGC